MKMIGHGMKKVVAAVLLSGVAVSCVFAASGNSVAAKEDKNVSVLVDDFEGKTSRNYLGGERGAWSLDPDDMKALADATVVTMKNGPENSTKSLKITYSVDSEKLAMNGVWIKLNNFDASPYDVLEFDLKGDEAKGFTETFKIEIKKFKDAGKLTGTKTVSNVTGSWQRVRIPLTYFNGIFDKSQQSVWKNPLSSLKNLDELVIVFHKRAVTKKTGVIYLDNIRFVKTGVKYPSVFDRPAVPTKDKAYIVLENPSFKREFLIPNDGEAPVRKAVGITDPVEIEEFMKAHKNYALLLSSGTLEYRLHINDSGKLGFAGHDDYMKFLVNRLGGFPSKTIVHKKFPGKDRDFLMEIAKDTWRFFDHIVDKEHGMPLDTIILGKDKPLGEGGSVGDYTNVTNIGVYLCCVVAAYDLGFITREDAVSRLTTTLNALQKIEYSESGFVYNYYDTTWGCRTEYFVSLVDCGWLAAGLYVVKNAFGPEVGSMCKQILDRGNFNFFYDPVERQMWHGYYENMDDYVNYHYGIFYAEPRLTSFIAIARGDVEEAHWFGMTRTFPRDYTWTTQPPKGRVEKKYKDISYWGGWYEYKNYKYVPSWGGSMFEALMPTLLIDEKKYAPHSLGLNDAMHVKAAIDYTLNELKYPVWGMSPSSNPDGGYLEYGVKPLGTMGYGYGAITPHASFLALEFAPQEAITNIRKMATGWDVYGEYGFYDAFEPKEGKVAYKYLALDQGMILMALDNYLNKGALRKYFESDPIFAKAKHLLSSEKFFSIRR